MGNKIKKNCDKCFRVMKEDEEIFEVNDEYICESCLDDRNTQFELLKDEANGK